jgi:prepilin-type N-terminal cleavage/methylation domain-containing protein
LKIFKKNVKIKYRKLRGLVMIKVKCCGFTLSEVLITLSIVGILAVLILPNLIKDTNNKANMALLQNTVGNINNAVQQELIRTKSKTIEGTDIVLNPSKFLKRSFDYTKDEYYSSDGTLSGVSYKTINGDNRSVTNLDAAVNLSNGVSIGISTSSEDNVGVIIDLNGSNPPNIIGVDYFALQISTKNSDGVHVGDVGASRYDEYSDSKLKTDCKNGDANRCYALVERSGFDPNYLEE